MTDLFSYTPPPSYPHAPGHRRTDTSRAAAKSIAPRAGSIQDRILTALRNHGPLATFELPAKVGVSYRSAQPRTSELRNLGLIADTGDRRVDPETDRPAIVWGLV